MLRTLHSLGQWNALLNDYINCQLSCIGDVMAGRHSETVLTFYCTTGPFPRHTLISPGLKSFFNGESAAENAFLYLCCDVDFM